VPGLVGALSDSQPLVRGHAAWALGEIASPGALATLEGVSGAECEPFALEEVAAFHRLLSKVKWGRGPCPGTTRDIRASIRDMTANALVLRPIAWIEPGLSPR
jgi:HEAT repeat protein